MARDPHCKAGHIFRRHCRNVFHPPDPNEREYALFGRNQQWLTATWQQYLLDTGAQTNPGFNSDFETFIAAWQARMPNSGSNINDTGLTAALTRIKRDHAFQFFGTNTMAKYWAYTNAILGQVDTSVIADTPAYGAFKLPSRGRSLVAYNPTNEEILVKFKTREFNSVVGTLKVPAQSIASRTPSLVPPSFKPATITVPKGRLYLQPTTTTLPFSGKLTSAPGTWLPTSETYPFPNNGDISKIKPSLTVVPVSTGNCSDLDLPGGMNCPGSNKAYAEWTGTFKGNLVGNKPFTQMTIYTDPALHPGWQQDPKIMANTHVRVEYYFDSTNTAPDRVEVYTLPSVKGNTFVMLQNKFTPYTSAVIRTRRILAYVTTWSRASMVRIIQCLARAKLTSTIASRQQSRSQQA